MKTLCYSVRLETIVSISDKAYKAIAFNGSTAILPKSQVFGQDYDVQKSNAYWIAAWILKQKELQFSSKKEAWFDEKGKMLPNYIVEKHKADKASPVENNEVTELKK